MDTTHIDQLALELAETDPAAAPDLADRLAAALAGALDGTEQEADPS